MQQEVLCHPTLSLMSNNLNLDWIKSEIPGTTYIWFKVVVTCKVIIFTLVLHTAHKMQPLDTSTFSSLKLTRCMSNYLQKHPGKVIMKYQFSQLAISIGMEQGNDSLIHHQKSCLFILRYMSIRFVMMNSIMTFYVIYMHFKIID